MKNDSQAIVIEQSSCQPRFHRLAAAGVFIGFLVLYHLNGDFLIGRDPMATVYLPISLLHDGDLAFTPEEMPHMFSWTYRDEQGDRPVRFESWDQKAVNLFTWSQDQTTPGLLRLGSVAKELSPQLTARDLRAAERLVPRQLDYYLVPSVDPERAATSTRLDLAPA